MGAGNPRTRGRRRRRLLEAVASVLLAVRLAGAATAHELRGFIVGPDGAPRPAALVDVMGPVKAVTAADNNGRFSIELSSGFYRIRIRRDNRHQEFRVMIDGADLDQTFRLAW